MVIRIELRIFNQTVPSASFGQKILNKETLKTTVCQTAPPAKLLFVFFYLFMKNDVDGKKSRIQRRV